jgi:hypothetical protein
MPRSDYESKRFNMPWPDQVIAHGGRSAIQPAPAPGAERLAPHSRPGPFRIRIGIIPNGQSRLFVRQDSADRA